MSNSKTNICSITSKKVLLQLAVTIRGGNRRGVQNSAELHYCSQYCRTRDLQRSELQRRVTQSRQIKTQRPWGYLDSKNDSQLLIFWKNVNMFIYAIINRGLECQQHGGALNTTAKPQSKSLECLCYPSNIWDLKQHKALKTRFYHFKFLGCLVIRLQPFCPGKASEGRPAPRRLGQGAAASPASVTTFKEQQPSATLPLPLAAHSWHWDTFFYCSELCV